MKTMTLSALLVMGLLATTTTALADHHDPIVSTDGLAPACELDGLDGDGRSDRIGNAWVAVDLLDQDGQPCLN